MSETERQALYDKAADLLERDGWCQGVYHDKSGAHCALGALHLAWTLLLCPEGLYDTHCVVLLRRLNQAGEGVISRIYNWNDAPGRTVEEVIALFRDKLPVPAHD